MNKQTEKNNIIYVLFIAVTFAVMIFLNFMTPLASDDIAHYYGMTGQHCETLKQIFEDMKLFRTSTNGRVFPHFIIYLFLTGPKWIFNIVNAAMAAVLLYELSLYLNKNIYLTMCAAFLMWIFIPDFGQVFLWLTGSVNYLWGLVLFLAFLHPYYKLATGQREKISIVLYSLLGFALGAWSENGATATIFACALFGLIYLLKNRKMPWNYFIPFLFCLMGYAFLMLAPATGDTRTGDDIMRNIWYIRVCIKDYCLWLIAAYVILLIISFVKKTDKKIILATLVIFFAGLLSILVFAFAAYLPARSFYVFVTFLILDCLLLLKELRSERILIIITLITALFFAFRFVKGCTDIVNLYQQSVQREELLSEEKTVNEIPAYSGKTKYAAFYDEELSEDENNWYNDLVAKYYGVSRVKKTQN